jgi:hypothetical protein
VTWKRYEERILEQVKADLALYQERCIALMNERGWHAPVPHKQKQHYVWLSLWQACERENGGYGLGSREIIGRVGLPPRTDDREGRQAYGSADRPAASGIATGPRAAARQA